MLKFPLDSSHRRFYNFHHRQASIQLVRLRLPTTSFFEIVPNIKTFRRVSVEKRIYLISTFLGYCDEWKLMAAGTAHGLVIFDCLQSTVVSSKCTLNAQGQYKQYYDVFCTFFN